MLNRLLILLLLVGSSCSSLFQKNSGRVLARVYSDYLYEEDLKGVVAPGTAPKDSADIARKYINSWIRQRLVIRLAEKNLSDQQLDFSRQLADYKSSLTIYAYENELVRQKLDTVVTSDQIQAYYDANTQNFLLKDNIVRMAYVKLPLKSPIAGQVRKLLTSPDSDSRNKLSEICEKNAADYFLDSDNWVYFSDVLKQVPLKTYNQEDYLRNHKDLEYQDSLFTYLVYFRDFRIKESVSPLEFETQRIRDILLNKRKAELIQRMQEDVFATAQRKNDFEIY